MSMLENALALAAHAHADVLDKGGQPYILHPLRVMLAVSPSARIAAVLHDVPEDTAIGLAALRLRGFRQDDVDAVDALTRREGEIYAEFILRCAADPIAKEVKIADLRDNLSAERLACFPERERESKGQRYRAALKALGAEP